MRFNTPVRTADERKAHLAELDNRFAVVGKNGRLDARALKSIDDQRIDLAELIVELIQDDLSVVDVSPFLVDRKSANFGDKMLFNRMDGVLSVVNRAYGSKPLSQRLTASEYGFTTSMKEIAIELPLEEIASGRFKASDAVTAMAYAISRYKADLAMTAIDLAVTAVADHTGLAGYNLRYVGFTQANFEHAIDGLRDDGEDPVIIGRHIAFAPSIRAFAGWSNEQKSEFLLRGQIGTFLGAPIVTLIDKWSRLLGGHQTSADRVIIAAGGSKGAQLIEKDVAFLNWAVVDEKNASFGTGIRLEDGVIVHDPFKYRVITRT